MVSATSGALRRRRYLSRWMLQIYTCDRPVEGSDGGFASQSRPPSCRNTKAAAQNSTQEWAADVSIEGKLPYDGPIPFSSAYFWGLVSRQRAQVAVGLLSVLICAACNLSAPVLTGFLFEGLTQGAPMASYWRTWAGLAAVYTIEPIFTQVYIRHVGAAAEAALAQMRVDLFRMLLGNRVEFFDRFSQAELVTLISSQLGAIRDTIMSNTSRDRGLRAFLEAAGSVCILVWLSAEMGPLMAVVIVASGVVAAVHSRRQKELFAADARQVTQMVGVAGEAIGAIRTVRSCAGEGLEQARFGAFVEASYDTGRRAFSAKAVQETLIRGSIHVALLLLFSLGGLLVAKGLMPVRALLSGIGFVFSLVFATQGVINSVSELRKGASAVDRIREVIAQCIPEKDVVQGMRGAHQWSDARLRRALGSDDEQPSTSASDPRPGSPEVVGKSRGNSVQEDRAQMMTAVLDRASLDSYSSRSRREAMQARDAASKHSLVLRGVSFRYPARRQVAVLEGLDLTIELGKVTALVGRSGSGKTTIASLIAQLYSPEKGDVLLGDKPVSRFTKQAWASAVALVSQEPSLFTGTIADNIAYGRLGDCSREEVEAASRTANAHEFVQKLPQGYDTVVGPQGTLLSGGQRQRIAVARALIKDAPILVLDEATSALDAVSERLVQEALERLEKGRTVLVIAHRLSTVQNADKIAVIGQGTVLEEGTHAELLQKGGHYAELVGSQRLAIT